MIYWEGKEITDRKGAWKLIQEGKIKCSCGRQATDFHNHKKDPQDWQALCTLCHAKVEGRESKWTPIGVLALRYADLVRTKNRINNLLKARQRIDWDAAATDLTPVLEYLETRIEELGKELESQVKTHLFWKFWLKDVKGVGPLSGALLIAVLERAWNNGIRRVRSQRKYFGLVPKSAFKTEKEKQKFHSPSKWLLSQALSNSIQMQTGLFGIRYRHHRQEIEERFPHWPDWQKYDKAWVQVAREFLKAALLKWEELYGEGPNPENKHPQDKSPSPEDWVKGGDFDEGGSARKLPSLV